MNMEKFSDSRAVLGVPVGSQVVTTGAPIDTQNYRSLTIALALTTAGSGITSVSFTESDTSGGTYVAVPASEVLFQPGAFPMTSVGQIQIGCLAKRRFVRLVVTGAAGSNYSALGLLQDSLAKPQEVNASVLANDDVQSPDATADASSTIPKRPVS